MDSQLPDPRKAGSDNPADDPSLEGDLLRLREEAGKSEAITVQTLIDTFGSESKLLLMIFIAVMNFILSPLPGQSTLCGIILTWISLTLLIRKPLPRLPGKIGGKALPSRYIISTLNMMAKWHARSSDFIRGRKLALSARPLKALTFVCLLWLSLVVLAPIPFGNAFAAIGIIMLCVGQAERDGNWLIGGWTISALHLALPWYVYRWVQAHPDALWW